MKNGIDVWCFTFGSSHYHPNDNVQLKDYWVMISGTFEESREAMFEKFGDQWSMQYGLKNFDPKYFPKGCYEFIVPDFENSLELLRSLADLQNGAPLAKWEDEWNEVMGKIHALLEKHGK